MSEREVGKSVYSEYARNIGIQRAQEEIRKRQVNTSTPEGRQEFQKLVIQYMQTAQNDPFSEDAYNKAVSDLRGVSLREYERLTMQMLLVARYKETFRQMAVVDPEDVWKAFQEKHHRRLLDLIELKNDDYRPKAKAKEGEPGYVSDEQVDTYYQRHLRKYDKPRRVGSN